MIDITLALSDTPTGLQLLCDCNEQADLRFAGELWTERWADILRRRLRRALVGLSSGGLRRVRRYTRHDRSVVYARHPIRNRDTIRRLSKCFAITLGIAVDGQIDSIAQACIAALDGTEPVISCLNFKMDRAKRQDASHGSKHSGCDMRHMMAC